MIIGAGVEVAKYNGKMGHLAQAQVVSVMIGIWLKFYRWSIFIKQLHSNEYLCPYSGSYFTKYVKYVNETRKEIK